MYRYFLLFLWLGVSLSSHAAEEKDDSIRTFTGHSDCVNAVAITPDGRHALSGSWDNTLKLWDLETGKELQTFTGHSGDVVTVAITPDGQRAVSGSLDFLVTKFNLVMPAEKLCFVWVGSSSRA